MFQSATSVQAIQTSPNETIVRAPEDAQLSLRCLVGANPLGSASILQIEWFKDDQKLDNSNSINQQHPPATKSAFQFNIERANHLHMGPSLTQKFTLHQQQSPLTPFTSTDSNQLLLASSKLLAQSTLTLKQPLLPTSAGSYSCQFKIIPAPAPSTSQQHHHTQANQLQHQTSSSKIISGRARQTIQVKLVEGRYKFSGK